MGKPIRDQWTCWGLRAGLRWFTRCAAAFPLVLVILSCTTPSDGAGGGDSQNGTDSESDGDQPGEDEPGDDVPGEEEPVSYVYAALQGLDQIAAFRIDGEAGALAALGSSPYTSGDEPHALAPDPSGQFLYVANFSGGYAASISAFAIASDSGELSELDGSPYNSGAGLLAIAVHPQGLQIYVPANSDSEILWHEVDTETGQLIGSSGTENTADLPLEVVVHPSLPYLYVSGGYGYLGDIILGADVYRCTLDASGGVTDPCEFELFLDDRPEFAAFHSSGDYFYVSNAGGGGGTLSALSVGMDGSLSQFIPTDDGCSPTRDLAFGPSDVLYVTSEEGLCVLSFNAESGDLTNLVELAIEVGSDPAQVAATDEFVVVTDRVDDVIQLYRIDSATGLPTLADTFPLDPGSAPEGVVIVPIVP
jgi:6-phosphogluconolactonase (cycloisomerase 2 family)